MKLMTRGPLGEDVEQCPRPVILPASMASFAASRTASSVVMGREAETYRCSVGIPLSGNAAAEHGSASPFAAVFRSFWNSEPAECRGIVREDGWEIRVGSRGGGLESRRHNFTK
jgi:hypothetical protein